MLPLQPVALLLAQLGRVRAAVKKDKRVFVEVIRRVGFRRLVRNFFGHRLYSSAGAWTRSPPGVTTTRTRCTALF